MIQRNKRKSKEQSSLCRPTNPSWRKIKQQSFEKRRKKKLRRVPRPLGLCFMLANWNCYSNPYVEPHNPIPSYCTTEQIRFETTSICLFCSSSPSNHCLFSPFFTLCLKENFVVFLQYILTKQEKITIYLSHQE